ncbi:MAG: YaeQ family protein [Verrucomicrobia bacterium]|nr:YaeQ family protein [Verrucomicrobiota bacterium]
MSGKYSFTLKTGDRRRSLPHKLILGCQETETARHVLLKLLAFLLFHRERLQIEPRLHDDNLPFRPDLVELDYQLRPCLWVECGECSVQKLDKLAVKAPEAELWILRGSVAEVQDLLAAMRKARLRQNRYHLLGLDHEPFEEILSRLVTRNEVFWVDGRLDPPLIQFDFNGFWFELDLHLFRF